MRLGEEQFSALARRGRSGDVERDTEQVVGSYRMLLFELLSEQNEELSGVEEQISQTNGMALDFSRSGNVERDTERSARRSACIWKILCHNISRPVRATEKTEAAQRHRMQVEKAANVSQRGTVVEKLVEEMASVDQHLRFLSVFVKIHNHTQCFGGVGK
ncbi:hypothetical protein HS088_TW21G00982 [Tripterygium wilfordii]|uniref:Uncharacterized protein n=1 Tax=Tripterygium wilfordii TaxID=458696 RepID=A0A7J7C3Z8_TRIWF|nr:hypothetical protein HS088_TW21G00982 [Tripterygium wilfordii]